MANIDVMATWNTCKALIAEGKKYVDAGYSNKKDTSGKKKMEQFLTNTMGYGQDDTSKQPGELPKEIANSLEFVIQNIIDFIIGGFTR